MTSSRGAAEESDIGSNGSSSAPEGPARNEPGPYARAAIGLGLIAFGVFLLLIAFRVIPIQPSRGIPHWIVGLLAGIPVLAGVGVMARRDSPVNDFVAALMFSAFALLGLWIGFGPGERRFSGGVSFGGFAIFGDGSVGLGRIVFGLAGLLIAVLAAYCWARAWRRWLHPR